MSEISKEIQRRERGEEIARKYPPPTKLDKSLYKSEIKTMVIVIPTALVNSVSAELKSVIFRKNSIRPVFHHPDDPLEFRRLILAPHISSESLDGATDVEKSIINNVLLKYRSDQDLRNSIRLLPHTLLLSYDNMTTEEILKSILPNEAIAENDNQVPSSYEVAGHLAHVNLKEIFFPWKYLIGQVYLDKNPGLKTIVNKMGSINTVFRTFPMEVIAGEDNTVVEHKHEGLHFSFDFRLVYWNSRLHTEHAYMTNRIGEKQIVADMFAGVGPFSFPLAANKNCLVYANDLNPHSFYWMLRNSHNNRKKVNNLVVPHCMDGRSFIISLAQRDITPKHVLMNLPADALSFCDVFVGFYRRYARPFDAPYTTTVHCYQFSKAFDAMSAADDLVTKLVQILRIPYVFSAPFYGFGAGSTTDGSSEELQKRTTVLGTNGEILSPRAVEAAASCIPGLEIREIRNVAPGKLMLCVSFPIPMAVGLAEPVVSVNAAPGALLHPFEGLAALENSEMVGGQAGIFSLLFNRDKVPYPPKPSAKEKNKEEQFVFWQPEYSGNERGVFSRHFAPCMRAARLQNLQQPVAVTLEDVIAASKEVQETETMSLKPSWDHSEVSEADADKWASLYAFRGVVNSDEERHLAPAELQRRLMMTRPYRLPLAFRALFSDANFSTNLRSNKMDAGGMKSSTPLDAQELEPLLEQPSASQWLSEPAGFPTAHQWRLHLVLVRSRLRRVWPSKKTLISLKSPMRKEGTVPELSTFAVEDLLEVELEGNDMLDGDWEPIDDLEPVPKRLKIEEVESGPKSRNSPPSAFENKYKIKCVTFKEDARDVAAHIRQAEKVASTKYA